MHANALPTKAIFACHSGPVECLGFVLRYPSTARRAYDIPEKFREKILGEDPCAH